LWLTRLLIQNGLGLFAAWTSLASFLSLAVFLRYELDFNMLSAGTVSLTGILVLIVTYFVLENFALANQLLYLYTPWLVILAGLSGSIMNNWSTQIPSRNNILTSSMMIVSVVFAAIKATNFVIIKACKKSGHYHHRAGSSSNGSDDSHSGGETQNLYNLKIDSSDNGNIKV
jgi:hypothetical protein